MKFMKLLSGAAAAFCLLVGASGAAMAVNTCEDGVIEGDVFEDIFIANRSCLIDDANVTGSIVAYNAEDMTIVGTFVTGRVVVSQSRNVIIVGNDLERNLTVKNNERADIAANRAGRRTITVNRNGIAVVKRNISKALICKGNLRLNALGNENREEDCSRIPTFPVN
jgi:hypothetical protein